MEALGKFCNGNAFPRDEVVEAIALAFRREHNTIQQCEIRLLWRVFQKLAEDYEGHGGDARNEASLEFIKKVAEETRDMKFPFV